MPGHTNPIHALYYLLVPKPHLFWKIQNKTYYYWIERREKAYRRWRNSR